MLRKLFDSLWYLENTKLFGILADTEKFDLISTEDRHTWMLWQEQVVYEYLAKSLMQNNLIHA